MKNITVAVTLLTLLCGCANLGAKPWQREALSRADMNPDSQPLRSALDDHIYFSKEAASGGRGFGGGGCGCN